MKTDERRIQVRAAVGEQIKFIARQISSSDTRRLEETIVDKLLHSLRMRGVVFNAGDGDLPKKVREAVALSGLYQFAEIVDSATTRNEFVELLRSTLPGTEASKLLCRPWRDVINNFGLPWKVHFDVARYGLDSPADRRQRKRFSKPMEITIPKPSSRDEKPPEVTMTPLQRAAVEAILSIPKSDTMTAASFEILEPVGPGEMKPKRWKLGIVRISDEK